MSDASTWPRHDYWMYDEDGNFIHRFALESYDGPNEEWIGSPEYEDAWTRQFFWSAEEAAALSFGRSPSADVFKNGYPDEMDGSDQFATYYCKLRDHIRDKQEAGELANPMPAKMYVDWALLKGLPMSPSLAGEVTKFFDKVTQPNPTTISVKEQTTSSEEIDLESIKELIGTRELNNLLGIVYAMFVKYHRLNTSSLSAVATSVTIVLDEVRKSTYASFEGKDKTIERLAKDLKERFSSRRGNANL